MVQDIGKGFGEISVPRITLCEFGGRRLMTRKEQIGIRSLSKYLETRSDHVYEYPRAELTISQVYETNIPDAKTKQFLGVLSDNQGRYLISNPRNNTELIRQPLTIAMSRGSDLSYKSVGVLRTNASDKIAPDTRGKSQTLKRRIMLMKWKITRTKDSRIQLLFKSATHL